MTEKLRLKDLGRWRSGGTPPKDRTDMWDGDLPWLSAKDINSDALREPTVFITEAAAQAHSQVVAAGSVVLIVRGMALAHGLPVVLTDRRAAFNQDLRALEVDRRFAPRFVYYALRGHRHKLNAHIDHAAHGTARVVDSIYGERIRVFTKTDQAAITEFLDRESERIEMAAAESRAFGSCLEASVRGAFADLTHGTGVVPLRRLIISIADGPFGSSLASAHYVDDAGVRVIRLGNIGMAEFKDHDRAFINPGYAMRRLAGHIVEPGDVIVAGLGDSGHPLGRACVAPTGIGSAVHKADCYRVVVDARRCIPEFLALALSYGPAAQKAPLLSRGATRARLNTVVARDLPVPLLPLNEQERVIRAFQAHRARARRLQDEMYGLVERLNEYRDALITEAVTGALDVSRVPEELLNESAHAVIEGQQPEVLSR